MENAVRTKNYLVTAIIVIAIDPDRRQRVDNSSDRCSLDHSDESLNSL